MQMLKLIELTLLLNLVSCAKDGPWNITVNKNITTTKGTDLIIPCNFTHPSDQQVKEIYWKTFGKSNCSKDDNDKQAFVLHNDKSCVLPNYKDKTHLIGDKNNGNCSLKISNIQENGIIYLRVSTDKDKYSFRKDLVSIHISGNKQEGPNPVTVPSEVMASTLKMPTDSGQINLVVCILVVALVIIVIIGIIVFIKYKRSRTITRNESGYYVNFSRATSNAPKSEESCKKLGAEPPEEKAIDEPIYINLEAPTMEMSPSTERHTDSIYANMDYSASEMI